MRNLKISFSSFWSKNMLEMAKSDDDRKKLSEFFDSSY